MLSSTDEDANKSASKSAEAESTSTSPNPEFQASKKRKVQQFTKKQKTLVRATTEISELTACLYTRIYYTFDYQLLLNYIIDHLAAQTPRLSKCKHSTVGSKRLPQDVQTTTEVAESTACLYTCIYYTFDYQLLLNLYHL